MTSGTDALTVAAKSPFPISNGGDGFMYAASLFAVVAISLLLMMRLIATGRQMWIDRKRHDRDAVKWFRRTVMLLCLAGLTSRLPEAVYKIAWGEVSPNTLHTILTVKEWSNPVAFMLVIGWIGIYTYFEPIWILKLSNPINRVWGGNRAQVHRFIYIVILSGLLAGFVALSKAFS